MRASEATTTEQLVFSGFLSCNQMGTAKIHEHWIHGSDWVSHRRQHRDSREKEEKKKVLFGEQRTKWIYVHPDDTYIDSECDIVMNAYCLVRQFRFNRTLAIQNVSVEETSVSTEHIFDIPFRPEVRRWNMNFPKLLFDTHTAVIARCHPPSPPPPITGHISLLTQWIFNWRACSRKKVLLSWAVLSWVLLRLGEQREGERGESVTQVLCF